LPARRYSVAGNRKIPEPTIPFTPRPKQSSSVSGRRSPGLEVGPRANLHVDVEAALIAACANRAEHVDVEHEAEVLDRVVPEATATAEEDEAEPDGVDAAVAAGADRLIHARVLVGRARRVAVDERAIGGLRRREIDPVAD